MKLYQNMFTDVELGTIRLIGDSLDLKLAKIVTPNGLANDKKKRKTRISWIDPDPDNYWIFQRLVPTMKEFAPTLNSLQSLQYSVYNRGAHYDWHVDRSKGTTDVIASKRVVSGVLMLSQPNVDFAGGTLCFKKDDTEYTANLNRGDVVLFGPEDLHRVTPVIHGVRRTVVFWGLEE